MHLFFRKYPSLPCHRAGTLSHPTLSRFLIAPPVKSIPTTPSSSLFVLHPFLLFYRSWPPSLIFLSYLTCDIPDRFDNASYFGVVLSTTSPWVSCLLTVLHRARFTNNKQSSFTLHLHSPVGFIPPQILRQYPTTGVEAPWSGCIEFLLRSTNMVALGWVSWTRWGRCLHMGKHHVGSSSGTIKLGG